MDNCYFGQRNNHVLSDDLSCWTKILHGLISTHIIKEVSP